MKPLESIKKFLDEHHLLSLATSCERLWCCSMFYAYLDDEVAFVVASDPQTEHMLNVSVNPLVAGTVALETKTVGKIRGIQFAGEMLKAESLDGGAYFERFPYARVMNPTLWKIRLDEIKMTDNTLGFGKKLIWKRDSSE
ncbi:MAG: pyridoxamine 5'-phosphate oxidase family protein [Sulfuricurvum sp.]